MPQLEIDDAAMQNIKILCVKGDEALEAGRHADAHKYYLSALEYVPEPKVEWEASTWIYTAIGNAAFLGGYYTTARKSLEFALHCPSGLGNPFIHLRLGQAYFELGELDLAADELLRAYMGDGSTVFDGEDHKYMDFLSSRAKGIQR